MLRTSKRLRLLLSVSSLRTFLLSKLLDLNENEVAEIFLHSDGLISYFWTALFHGP